MPTSPRPSAHPAVQAVRVVAGDEMSRIVAQVAEPLVRLGTQRSNGGGREEWRKKVQIETAAADLERRRVGRSIYRLKQLATTWAR